MANWVDPIGDLRRLLSDGSNDKLRYRKRVMGKQDGTNLVFKSFEFRRVTDLTTAVAPFGAYVDDLAVAVSTDDPITGEFTLATAPTDGQTLRCTYYVQWFNDTELTEFLRFASNQVGSGDDYTTVSIDFQPAAAMYGAYQAYMKLALRFVDFQHDVYQLEDQPDEKNNPFERYMSMADKMLGYAQKLRDDVYTRKGQALAPRFQTLAGTVRDVKPNR